MFKEHLEVFGQAQAEHSALPADEIARLIRRDDDDGLAVGAVNRADLLEDGERGVRFGESLADDDLPKLGEVDRARRGRAQQPQRAQAARRGGAEHDIARFGLFKLGLRIGCAFAVRRARCAVLRAGKRLDSDGQVALRRGVHRHGDDEQPAFDLLPAGAAAQQQEKHEQHQPEFFQRTVTSLGINLTFAPSASLIEGGGTPQA